MTPTWLYVKVHNITGLKYFGKTIQNPIKYKGSGKHWIRHLKKHGNNVSTIWKQMFTDKNELTEYAIRFSKDNNIVESDEWANLKIEDGLDGGTQTTTEIRNKISKSLKNVPKSDQHKQSLSEAMIGYKQTEQHRNAVSISKTGTKHSEESKQRMRKPKSTVEKMRQLKTTETKTKISKALKGRPSPSKGMKLGPSKLTGRKQSPELIAKRTEAKRINKLLKEQSI